MLARVPLRPVRRAEAEAVRHLAALRDAPRAGRPPTHPPAVRSQLIALAVQTPRSLGEPFALWTLERLQRAFETAHLLGAARQRKATSRSSSRSSPPFRASGCCSSRTTNLSTHHSRDTQAALLAWPDVRLQFLSTYAAWLNLIEP